MTGLDPRKIRLLHAALDLEPAERDAFVVHACADDADLLAALRALLALDASPGLPLDRPLEQHAAKLLEDSHDDAEQAHSGLRIGAWRLLRELGRGGMGSVWLGERDDGQYRQQVAIKLIRLGMDSEHILRQFRRERALLARLQHPNIAQLIDGGIDQRGRPWFAMEYVAGIGLGQWLEREQATLRERLQLFVKLCRAVAHAHRQLIVHRDLKPSNVLVQADGEPRLLDFGIARLVDQDADERTATMQHFLTRDFAAPEQLRGEPAGTSADVYALGLILFELLTGQRYRKLHALGNITLRPSSVLEAGATGSGAIDRGQLRGDLDAIVAHALADDPTRRYADAQQLGDDVQRHLDDAPIKARPDRFGYRAGKFLHRNRATVAVGILGLLALFAASGIAIRQAIEKTVEAERARVALKQSEATRKFISSVFLEADPAGAKGADTTAGELLAAARERIARELSGEPEVAAELLDQIGNTYVSLGDAELARATLKQALTFNERARHPSLAIAASAGGRLAYYAFGDGEQAASLAQIDTLIARLRKAGNEDPELAAQLAKMHEFRGSMLYAMGRKQDARAAKQAAVALWSTLRGEHPLEYLFAELGLSDLNAALGDGQAALEGAQRALADPHLQGADAPPALVLVARGARVRALQALGRHAQVEPMLRELIDAHAAQYGIDNSMTRYWRFRHAETLHALGRLDEAQAVADAVIALPADGSAAYRRTRTVVLAARIARDRNATDAAARIRDAQAAACGSEGNADLCREARDLANTTGSASTRAVSS